jgi:hypothetical protein
MYGYPTHPPLHHWFSKGRKIDAVEVTKSLARAFLAPRLAGRGFWIDGFELYGSLPAHDHGNEKAGNNDSHRFCIRYRIGPLRLMLYPLNARLLSGEEASRALQCCHSAVLEEEGHSEWRAWISEGDWEWRQGKHVGFIHATIMPEIKHVRDVWRLVDLCRDTCHAVTLAARDARQQEIEQEEIHKREREESLRQSERRNRLRSIDEMLSMIDEEGDWPDTFASELKEMREALLGSMDHEP